MMYNRVKIACRNLWKDRFYAGINIAGLALAAAAFLLIAGYVRFEYSYEAMHPKADRIYRVTLDLYNGAEYVTSDAETYPPLAPFLKQRLPEVQEYVRMQQLFREEMSADTTAVLGQKIYAADPSVLRVFNFPLVAGNPATALQQPGQAVVSRATARKLFGNANAMGRTLKIRDKVLTVSGIMEDVPQNTHLRPDVLVPYAFLRSFGIDTEGWSSGNNSYTFLQMAAPVNLAGLNRKLKLLSDEKLDEKRKGEIMTAQPLKDIHLHSHKEYEPEVNGDARTVRFLAAISFLILLTGAVNYVNLTTARAAERAKEGAIRKVLGSSRWSLALQFFTESLVVNLLAFALALLLVRLALPLYVNIVGQPAVAGMFVSGGFWLMVALLFVFSSLLSGLYPAIAMAGVKPVSITHRSFTGGGSGALRKMLVTGQFVAAVVVMVAAFIVFRQLWFMRHQPKGMNIDEVLVLRAATAIKPDSLQRRENQAFMQQLLAVPGVKHISGAGAMPGQELNELGSNNYITREGQPAGAGYNYYMYAIDAGFIPLMQIPLIAGRNFRAGAPNVDEVIINLEAVHRLGFGSPAAALGQRITARFSGTGKNAMIVGVIGDYRQRSVKEARLPMIHPFDAAAPDYYALKIDGADAHRTVAAVQKVWQSFYPAHPFSYYFLDELFNRQYQADERFGQIVAIFSIFTIFITCLGLIGLSAYNVSRRAKEIGIRKVLGASVAGIVQLLAKDFLKLVLIAVAIATPIAWWLMGRWLQGFDTRIAIQWWMFAGAGVVALLLALAAVALQSAKAALANPVNSLRSE